MKKFLSILAAVLCIAFANSVQTAQAAPEQDFRASVTSVAATVTYTFTNSDNVAFSAFNADNLYIGATANTGTTFTVSYVLGSAAALTNVACTSLGTGNRLIRITNAPTFFVGDKLLIGSSDTNTFTDKIIGRRR